MELLNLYPFKKYPVVGCKSLRIIFSACRERQLYKFEPHMAISKTEKLDALRCERPVFKYLKSSPGMLYVISN